MSTPSGLGAPRALAGPRESDATARARIRPIAEQVLRRSAGAPLVEGNAVRVLRDARENYPAWERAIQDAVRTIHVEMYIIRRDAIGRRFVDVLAERARAGVTVRVLYDWFGCGVGPSLGLFTPLVRAGGQVRVFNPPRLAPALGWIRRNHRKLIVVDGRVAFVGGLCVAQMWAGRPERRQDPWRDTGVELAGPVLAQTERAFADSWALAGGSIPPDSLPVEESIPRAGGVSLRLIATEPFTASLLRTDLLIAAMARRSLWISDAYFIDHGPFIEALRLAARDGVDVRLLLPQGSDVGWTVTMSRSLYRELLDAGVRIFEWNGAMMHAKTAVADGRWARVGSSNLNVNSWFGNWELDVAVEDTGIAQVLEAHYEEDLALSTEIVSNRPRPLREGLKLGRRGRPSARRALRTVTGLGHSIGAAMTGKRPLERFEATPLLLMGTALVVLALALLWTPALASRVFAAIAAWIGVSFVVEALALGRRRPKS